MRELALWDAEGLERSFGDVEELASACRFSDCSHAGEPGCAVALAVSEGRLDADRIGAWRKLERETAHHERRVDALARAEERRKWKVIGKSVGRHMDAKYGTDGWR
jgi:ribosome biogenesis GTPase